MGKKSLKKPKHIQLSPEQFEALQLKIQETKLDTADKDLITGSLSSFLWLKSQLEQSKITIAQLKSLFGITTEKKSLKDLKMMLMRMEQIPQP